MLAEADALVSYRTYPHVDMAKTGELAARLLKRRIKRGSKEPMAHRRLPYLIPFAAQSTWLEPAKSRYEEIFDLDREFDTCLSFCMAFPASDIEECAPMVWGYGERAEAAVQQLYANVSEPTQWTLEMFSARDAVERACVLGETNEKPVVI
jgi:microcystin degradation protein MlrC